MRARADADRPYLLAVQDIIAQWADAETQYDEAVESVEWARSSCAELQAQPDADPLDIASAKLDIKWRTHASARDPARAALPSRAAGGTRRASAGRRRRRTRSSAATTSTPTRRTPRRRRARASAPHANASMDCVVNSTAPKSPPPQRSPPPKPAPPNTSTTQRAQLDTELRVLQVAGRYQDTRPLRLPAAALTGLPTPTAAALTSLAELPFTVTPVRAVPSKQRTLALHALHAAATAADRKILWCSSQRRPQPTGPSATSLADTATTITNAHQQIRDGTGSLPPAACSSSTKPPPPTPPRSPTSPTTPPPTAPASSCSTPPPATRGPLPRLPGSCDSCRQSCRGRSHS